jgi:hypothetical protein
LVTSGLEIVNNYNNYTSILKYGNGTIKIYKYKGLLTPLLIRNQFAHHTKCITLLCLPFFQMGTR